VRRLAIPQVGEPLGGAEHRVDVHQRLAHPHEDEVVDRLHAAEVQRLVEDLRRGQVASEAHLAGRAEGAGQRAAGLRGDADRAPTVGVAHQDGLDGTAVAGAKQRLDGSVSRVGLAGELERRERDPLRELGAQPGRQVGHLGVGARAARRPGPGLARAEGRLARLGQRPLEEVEIHIVILGGACGSPSTWPGPAWRRAARPRS
jgi:hypothetical protein